MNVSMIPYLANLCFADVVNHEKQYNKTLKQQVIHQKHNLNILMFHKTKIGKKTKI
jgi:hypothetical protein